MVVVCLIFERMLRLCFCPCVFIFYMEFAIQNVYCGNTFNYKWYAIDIVFYVCNVKCLFKWFI